MEISRKQRIFGSWWIFLNLIMFFNGISIVYAGIVTKCKKWKITGMVYITLSWITGFSGLIDIFLIIWLVCIIHTICIRKEYFIRLNIIRESKDIIKAKELEKDKELIKKVYNDIIGENSIDNIKQIKEENKIEKKLNINTCSEQELLTVPGMGIILSKKVIDFRNSNGNFDSMSSFYLLLNISDDKRERLDEYLECKNEIGTNDINIKNKLYKENDKKVKNNKSGRKIDI